MGSHPQSGAGFPLSPLLSVEKRGLDLYHSFHTQFPIYSFVNMKSGCCVGVCVGMEWKYFNRKFISWALWSVLNVKCLIGFTHWQDSIPFPAVPKPNFEPANIKLASKLETKQVKRNTSLLSSIDFAWFLLYVPLYSLNMCICVFIGPVIGEFLGQLMPLLHCALQKDKDPELRMSIFTMLAKLLLDSKNSLDSQGWDEHIDSYF